MKSLKFGFLLAALFVCSTCCAQGINVTVDGEPVAFQGVGPQSVQGRTLVPLRGVLEKMGAYVEWVPATRSVFARKDDREVILPVGARTATVNGAAVTLDVPAMIMSGTTMVPLRFLGEALGAGVKWDGATRTVIITSGATVPETTATAPEIVSFSHDAADWLVAGSRIHVQLKGTTGGKASFGIPGVVDKVDMSENAQGHYVGTWQVPPNANTISGASVIGRLVTAGGERLIQSAVGVNIDLSPPVVKKRIPEPDSTTSQVRPLILAEFDDAAGSGIDTTRVILKLDGQDVTEKSELTGSYVVYRPETELKPGGKQVELVVADKAGHTVSVPWSFSVTTETVGIVVASFSPSDEMEPGDVVNVQMEGEANGKASFLFAMASGVSTPQRSMQEVSPGRYQGEYTIRKNDDFMEAKLVVTLTSAAGKVYTWEHELQATDEAVALSAPVITSPAAGSKVSSPLTVTGTAPPDSTVRLKVDYTTTVLGAVGLSGALSEQNVVVDAKGQFRSEPIQLGTLIKGDDTQYTITAVTVLQDGSESDAVVVKISGK